MSNSRLAALRLLEQVLLKKQPLEEAMKTVEAFDKLTGSDRGFARALTSETLRQYGRISKLLLSYMNTGKQAEPFDAHLILCLGVTQLLLMETAPHAAINETVDLCKSAGLSSLSGLVNAVLRRVSENGKEKFNALSDALNFPDWLYQSWINDYGEQETKLIAHASLQQAPTDITIKKTNERSFWKENLHAHLLPLGSLRLPEKYGEISELPGYHDGSWWVQDIAASLPVKLLGSIEHQDVLDLCAAPGGKTMQLAKAGAFVTALDRSSTRMKRSAENLDRTHLGTHVKSVIADALSWSPTQNYDAILLDVPCSATGTIRRHPDLLHIKSAQDIEKLSALQIKLLDKAALMLKKGGTLLYSTCSLQKREGEQQVNQFLQDNPNFIRKPIAKDELAGLEGCITPFGDLRCLPHHLASFGGMDGFYAARLIKQS